MPKLASVGVLDAGKLDIATQNVGNLDVSTHIVSLLCTVFRDYLDMPKMLIKAANDEFFMLDDNQFFFDDLPGFKYNW